MVKQGLSSGQSNAPICSQRITTLYRLPGLRFSKILQRPISTYQADKQILIARFRRAHQQRGLMILNYYKINNISVSSANITIYQIAIFKVGRMNQIITVSLSDMLCFICQDYFCFPYTAHCGHSFCRYCLDQYFLYAKICPCCSSQIRGKEIHRISILDEFVERFLRTQINQLQRYEARRMKQKKYFKGRGLKSIKIGGKVDIRDDNYIWNKGMIAQIFGKLGDQNKYLKILYLDYLQKKQQQIIINSDRLANQGFYTSRKDIPFYQKKKINAIINDMYT